MKKINYNDVDDATSRLEKIKADTPFPGLLSDRQLEEIQQRRIKKEKIARKKTGVKTKVKDVTPTEYLVKGGGVDDNGNPIDDFDITKYMNDAEDPATGTLRDFTVDTRQLYHAKNFYDFTMNVLAADAPKYSIPWARQMWIGLMLFSEVCPCCSDKRVFDIHNIPKNIEPDRLLKRMVLLEYGVCPKCKRHKWDLIKNHGLKNYRQLVNVLGQRSGKSSSAGQYYAYLTHQYLMFPNIAELAPSMFQASTQLTCTMVSLNFAKALGVMWTPYKKLVENSSWFCVAEGTPVRFADGSTKSIEKTVEGDVVKTFEGAQPVTKVFDNGVKDCTEVALENGATLVATEEHKVQCLSADGESLVWKRVGDLSESDFVVVE